MLEAIAGSLTGVPLLSVASPGELTRSRLQLLEIAVRFVPGAAEELVRDARAMQGLFSLDEDVVWDAMNPLRWQVLNHLLCHDALKSSGLRIGLITKMLQLLAQSPMSLSYGTTVFLSNLRMVDDDAEHAADECVVPGLQAAAGECATSLVARLKTPPSSSTEYASQPLPALGALEALLRGPNTIHGSLVDGLEGPLLEVLPACGHPEAALVLLELLSRIGKPAQNPRRLRTLGQLLPKGPVDFGAAGDVAGSAFAVKCIKVLEHEFECGASCVEATLKAVLEHLRRTHRQHLLCPDTMCALEKMVLAAVHSAPRAPVTPLEQSQLWRLVYLTLVIREVGLDWVPVASPLASCIQLFLMSDRCSWWIPTVLPSLDAESQLCFALTLCARLLPGEPNESQFHPFPHLGAFLINRLLAAEPDSPLQQRIIAAIATMATKRLAAAPGSAPVAVKAVRAVVPEVLTSGAGAPEAGGVSAQAQGRPSALFYDERPDADADDLFGSSAWLISERPEDSNHDPSAMTPRPWCTTTPELRPTPLVSQVEAFDTNFFLDVHQIMKKACCTRVPLLEDLRRKLKQHKATGRGIDTYRWLLGDHPASVIQNVLEAALFARAPVVPAEEATVSTASALGVARRLTSQRAARVSCRRTTLSRVRARTRWRSRQPS